MEIAKLNKTRLLIDADSLFDLRQAKILHYDFSKKKEYEKYFLSEAYHFREIDAFDYPLSSSMQLEELLPYTTTSYLMPILNDKIGLLETRNAMVAKKSIPEVILNIYPYYLDKKYEALITDALFLRLQKKCFIKIVRFPLEEITPVFIKNSDIAFFFLYSFNDWINLHADAIDKNPITDSFIYFPSLYKVLPKEEDYEKLKKLGFKEFFSYFEYLFSQKATIRFLPTIMYSSELLASVYLEKMNNVLLKESLKKEGV